MSLVLKGDPAKIIAPSGVVLGPPNCTFWNKLVLNSTGFAAGMSTLSSSGLVSNNIVKPRKVVCHLLLSKEWLIENTANATLPLYLAGNLLSGTLKAL